MPGGTVKYSIVADAKPFTDATAVAAKELQKLTDKATESAGSLGKVALAAGPVGQALAVATGIGVAGFAALAAAVAGAVKGLVETGGHLADLSAQTGISTQALQKLAYAGSLVGVSQEAITGAAVKMEKAIANGDDVFQRLGLSVQKLKAMQPDQAFAAVAAQIARIKDPASQAAAAMEVFGKSGATMLPLIKSNLKEAGEEAERLGIILSDKTVNASDALGDEATKLGAAWEGVKNQFAAAIVENPKLLQGLQSLVATMGNLAHAIMDSKSSIGSWAAAFVDGIGTVAKALIALGNNPAVKALNSVMGSVVKWTTGASLVGLAGNIANMSSGAGGSNKTGWNPFGGPMAAPGGAGAAAGGGGINFTAKGSAAEIAAAQKAGEAAANAAEQAVNRVNAEYERMSQLLHQSLMAQKKDIEAYWKDQERQASEYGQWYLSYITARQAGEKAIMEAWAAIQEQAHLKALQGVRDLASAFDEVGGSVGHFAADGLRALANLNDEAIRTASSWQKLAMAIQGAVAAYNAGKAAGSPGKGALAGAGKGAAAGAAFGPYGMVIGAVAGAAIGFFGGKKAQKEELAGLRQEFTALMAQAQQAGTVLQHAFDPRTAQQYKQAIDEIKGAMDLQGEAQEKLNDAVQRYGFTIDELGPVMQRQELDKQAGQLYQDWMLLNQAGIDHGAIIERMGPAINEYVQNAIAAGGEIPAAFKPIIDDLISQGKLLDENGNAYTSAEDAGITYAQTMSQMFQDLIKHVEELVNAIRGVPDKTATITVRTVREGGGGGGGDDVTVPDDSESGPRSRVRGYASGGVFPPRPGGHVVRIAEGGQAEAIVNPQQMAALMGGSPEALEELREMNTLLRRMPQAIGLAARDMVMVGGRK